MAAATTKEQDAATAAAPEAAKPKGRLNELFVSADGKAKPRTDPFVLDGKEHTVTWKPIGFEAMTELTSKATADGKTDYAKLALEALNSCVIAIDGEPVDGSVWGAMKPTAGNKIVEIVVGSLQGLGEAGQGN